MVMQGFSDWRDRVHSSEVHTFKHVVFCEKKGCCGTMAFTGMTRFVKHEKEPGTVIEQAQYEHVCDKCDNAEWFTAKFPYRSEVGG